MPPQWPDGRTQGLRVRGGFKVDIAWKRQRLVAASITALKAGPCRLRYAERVQDIMLAPGQTFHWDGGPFLETCCTQRI